MRDRQDHVHLLDNVLYVFFASHHLRHVMMRIQPVNHCKLVFSVLIYLKLITEKCWTADNVCEHNESAESTRVGYEFGNFGKTGESWGLFWNSSSTSVCFDITD